MQPFIAYTGECNELNDARGGFIGYYEVVSKWYRRRRHRGQEERFESIRITIRDSGASYYGRHCLDNPEVLLKQYKGGDASN